MITIDATRATEPEPPVKWFPSRSAHTYAITFWLLSLVALRQPLSSLASLSFHDERSSHILLVPLISTLLLYLERKHIFRATRYCPKVGLPLLLLALVLWYVILPHLSSLGTRDPLSVVASLIVLVWIAIFVLCYGVGSFRNAAFPMMFLLLMIPLPITVAEHAVAALQKGSAETCHALFRLLGIPFVRHGFQFSLPGVDIEVAEQCSGIHSAMALFIAGLLAQHLLLRGSWRKVCFALFILPIAVFKNAVRIVTISWLGIHVNPDFFHGQLHRQGGLPFSFLALALMTALLWLLRSLHGKHVASGRRNNLMEFEMGA